MEDGAVRNVADYFVVAGLPSENPQLLDEYSLEVNLKPSAYQDPIIDITVRFLTVFLSHIFDLIRWLLEYFAKLIGLMSNYHLSICVCVCVL